MDRGANKNSKVEAKEKKESKWCFLLIPAIPSDFNTHFWRETAGFSVRIRTRKASCQAPCLPYTSFLTTPAPAKSCERLCSNTREAEGTESVGSARPFTGFCFPKRIWFARNAKCNYVRATSAFQKSWNFLLLKPSRSTGPGLPEGGFRTAAAGDWPPRGEAAAGPRLRRPAHSPPPNTWSEENRAL